MNITRTQYAALMNKAGAVIAKNVQRVVPERPAIQPVPAGMSLEQAAMMPTGDNITRQELIHACGVTSVNTIAILFDVLGVDLVDDEDEKPAEPPS